VQLSLRPPAQICSARWVHTAGEAGLICAGGGRSCLKFWEAALLGGWALAPASCKLGPLLPAAGLWLAWPWPASLLFPGAAGCPGLLAAGFFAYSQPAAAGALWPVCPCYGPVAARHLPLGMAEAGRVVAR